MRLCSLSPKKCLAPFSLTQISQVRVYLSGAIGGGLGAPNITYTYGNVFDFSNALGPNLWPPALIGGSVGLGLLPLGVGSHHMANGF